MTDMPLGRPQARGPHDVDDPSGAAPARSPRKAARAEKKRSSMLVQVGDLILFSIDALRALPGTFRYSAEIFRQASILVRGSTVVIAAMCTFIGMTQVNFAYFFLRSAGASDFTGVFTGLTTPRAAIPIMFGYVFSAKVGGGLAAEIAAMRVSEEVDALEVEGVNPMSYLIGTRLLGALLFAPVAVIVALLAGTAGSYFQAIPVLQGLTSGGFLQYHWGVQNLTDQLLSFVNLTTQAIIIVLVSTYFGYRARGGPAAVGSAVAKSLLVNIVLVHVVASFYILVFYGQDPQLPIGG